MQTGVITADNFSQILRPISQRRQNGELIITSGDDVTKILFDKGKIVEVTKHESTNYEKLLEKLTLAGLMEYGDIAPPTSYKEARSAFLSATHLEPEEIANEKFELAVQELIYDQLYSFKPHTGALYSFEMKGIEIDFDLLPSIPVNQYLLELPDVDEVLSRSVAFEEEPPFEFVRMDLEKGESVRDFLAKHIADVLMSGESLIVDDLKLRSLLSEYHFWRAFFQLLDDEIVVGAEEGDDTSVQEQDVQEQHTAAQEQDVPEEVGESPSAVLEPNQEEPNQEEEQVDTEDVLSFLENAIDESFDTEPIQENSTESLPRAEEEEGAPLPDEISEADEHVSQGAHTTSARKQATGGLNRSLLQSRTIPHLVNFFLLAAVLVSFFVYWQSFFIFMGRV